MLNDQSGKPGSEEAVTFPNPGGPEIFWNFLYKKLLFQQD